MQLRNIDPKQKVMLCSLTFIQLLAVGRSWTKPMCRMIRTRGRKMMMLRMGRTDPKTATHTLREPAQSKCTSTFHNSHIAREFTDKMPQAKTATQTLHEPLTLCTSHAWFG